MTCKISEITIGDSMRALTLENDILSTTVLVDKGADIYELVYKPLDMDVMWKSPWGMKQPGRGFLASFESESAWLEAYAGGWQVLFPNGGDANIYKGAHLSYHGEASMRAWDWQIISNTPRFVEVHLSTRLLRTPWMIERFMSLEAGSPVLHIRERVKNHAGVAMDCMWSHHPAFGAPFLSQHCRVDIGSGSLLADPAYEGFANPLQPGKRYDFPIAECIDMSCQPSPEDERDIVAYFTDFDAGWYGITNTEMGLGIGLVWDAETFPYAWYWQEMHGTPVHPFYKNCYVMAIEPASSIPGHGLSAVIASNGSHLTFRPGESREIEIKAVFYRSDKGIDGIASDGSVRLK